VFYGDIEAAAEMLTNVAYGELRADSAVVAFGVVAWKETDEEPVSNYTTANKKQTSKTTIRPSQASQASQAPMGDMSKHAGIRYPSLRLQTVGLKLASMPPKSHAAWEHFPALRHTVIG